MDADGSSDERTQFVRRTLWLGLAVAFVLLLALLLRHVSGPRIVARLVTPDGVEMRLVQRCTWNAEPFTTGFYYRRPGGQWGWFYYSHQDSYWGNADVRVDTNSRTAVFFRGETPAVTFRWDDDVYTLHRRHYTVTGAQVWLPLGSSPEGTAP